MRVHRVFVTDALPQTLQEEVRMAGAAGYPLRGLLTAIHNAA